MRRIVIANKKGGAGKTSTTCNLAHALCQLGRRVLVVDVDEQRHSTKTLMGTRKPQLEYTLYDVLGGGVPAQKAIVHTDVGVDLLPADQHLHELELNMTQLTNRERRLQRCLNDVDGYDYCLFDTNPSWGLLTKNAVAAADEIVIPVVFDEYAIDGVAEFVKYLQEFATDMELTLKITAVVPIAVDMRFNHRNMRYMDILKGIFRDRVSTVTIRTDGQVKASQENWQTVITYNHKAKAAEDYVDLARLIDAGEEAVVNG